MDNNTFEEVVSSDSESLILVDEHDQEIGFEQKGTCHDGQGLLHRAFSIFVFNSKGEVLLQQRSQQKRLWPLYWSNTCCSHPRQGESLEYSTQRRLQEELQISCELIYLYKFQYHAEFENKGSEHELCSVFVGKTDIKPTVNINEIAAWRYISPENLSQELEDKPECFTPWFKMEWQRIISDFSHVLG